MDSPIKLMDEIKADLDNDEKWPLTAVLSRWQPLRTAIEAQAEELTQMKHMTAQLYQAAGAYDMPERVLDVLSDMASGDPLRHKNILPVQSPETDEELAQARARIGRLEDALKFLTNSDNYLEPTFHPEEIALEALNESEPQSLAAVKAEARIPETIDPSEYKLPWALTVYAGARFGPGVKLKTVLMSLEDKRRAARIEQESES